MSVCLSVCVVDRTYTAVRGKVERENQRYCQIDFDAYSINVTYIASCSTVHALNDYVTVCDRFIAQGHPS